MSKIIALIQFDFMYLACDLVGATADEPDSSVAAAMSSHHASGSDDPAWLDLGPSDVASASNDERSQAVLQAYYDERGRATKAAPTMPPAAPTDKQPQQRSTLSASTTAAASRRAAVSRVGRAGVEPTKLFATDMLLAADTPVA